MTQPQVERRGSVVVRVDGAMWNQVKMIAALNNMKPQEVLRDAWNDYRATLPEALIRASKWDAPDA
jgi:hypothetical protein